MKDDDKTGLMPSLMPHTLGFDKPKKIDPEQAEEDAEAAEHEEPQAIPPADPFGEEIARIRRAQSPAVLEAIDASPCFGKAWFVDPGEDLMDEGEAGICPSLDCDLREWCQLVWQRATNQQMDQSTDNPPESAEEVLKLKSPKQKRIDGKYLRHPYISTGRPVDKLAHRIWELLGGPPELPSNWTYPPARTKEQQEIAAGIFIEMHGSGMICSRRQFYHQYFREGRHFLRFWIKMAGGGWADLSTLLAKAIVKYTDLSVEQLPLEKRKQKQYWHYPYRIYISKLSHLKRLAPAFEKLEIKALAEICGPGGPGGENEDQGF